MKLHREGYYFISRSFLIFFIAGLLAIFLLPWWGWQPIVFNLLVIFFLCLRFFRNPDRTIEFTENGDIFAPADGTVVVIEKTFEGEYFQEERIQVSVFMSVFNVHVNRYPISGTVEYVRYHPGKFLVAMNPKSSTDNERNSVVLKQSSGRSLLVRQIAGALAKRIVCYAKSGDSVVQGADLGFIKFGSRVDLFLPATAKMCVSLGEKVQGNRTIIATWE